MNPADVGAAIIRDEQRILRALSVGGLRAAERGRTHMVRQTPTDQGQLRASWHVVGSGAISDGDIAELINDAPMAGVVELGARPHPVSQAGLEAIAAWVLRKGLVTSTGTALFSGPSQYGQGRRRFQGKSAEEAAAMAIAQRIAWKLRTQGQKPTFFVANELDTLGDIAHEEVGKAVRAALDEIGRAP